MSNEIRVVGNVGANPEMKQINDKTVTNLSIFCDEWSYDNDKKEYVERDGEWYDVSIWYEPLGKMVFETVKKGARIEVVGHLRHRTYTDKTSGKEVTVAQISADDVTHKLNRIAHIEMRKVRISEPATA
jgi:single-strand DNA-binding protein